jgi:hypothetical protein
VSHVRRRTWVGIVGVRVLGWPKRRLEKVSWWRGTHCSVQHNIWFANATCFGHQALCYKRVSLNFFFNFLGRISWSAVKKLEMKLKMWWVGQAHVLVRVAFENKKKCCVRRSNVCPCERWLDTIGWSYTATKPDQCTQWKGIVNAVIFRTCFGHSCGNPQGGALRRISTLRCYESFIK